MKMRVSIQEIEEDKIISKKEIIKRKLIIEIYKWEKEKIKEMESKKKEMESKKEMMSNKTFKTTVLVKNKYNQQKKFQKKNNKKSLKWVNQN